MATNPWDQLPIPVAELARRAGCSDSMLRKIKRGARFASRALAKRIESESGNVLKAAWLTGLEPIPGRVHESSVPLAS